MRPRNPAHRTSAAAGLAAGGVLAGHVVAYAILAPRADVRARLLESTGHGYLPAANTFALFAVLITVGALFLGRLTRPWATPSGRSLAGRIAAFQVGAFVAMETFERLGSGASLGGMLHGGLLPVGIATQLAIAGAVAVFVRLLLHVSDRLATAFGRTPLLREARGISRLPGVITALGRIDVPLPAGRGPPLPR